MATRRREGDWRLEERGEGIYEITLGEEPRLRLRTTDAPLREREGQRPGPVPVRTVPSVAEVDRLFEALARGAPPAAEERAASETSMGGSPTGRVGSAGDLDPSALPPLGTSAVLLLGGVLLLAFSRYDGNVYALVLGAGFATVGVAIVAHAVFLAGADDWRAAWRFLVAADEDGGSAADDAARRPAVSGATATELLLERAEHRCEYCDAEPDRLDLHRIVPPGEGGSNEPSNLIALCPACRQAAERDDVPRASLEEAIAGGTEIRVE